MSGTRQVRCGFGDDSGQLLTQWVALIEARPHSLPGFAEALAAGDDRGLTRQRLNDLAPGRPKKGEIPRW
jgi:hypothetical protein